MRSCLIASILLLGAALTASAAEQDSSQLEQWLQQQVELQSWSADVTQTRRLKSLVRPLVAAGSIWVLQPKQFRWQLGDPPRTIAIGTEVGLTIAYPRLRQLELYAYSDAVNPSLRQILDLLEVGFPSSAEAFHERYSLVQTIALEAGWRFELQPRAADAQRFLDAVYIEVGAVDMSLQATELVFPDGSVMRNEFSNPQIDQGIDVALFQLEPGPDWQISEPLSTKPLN